MKALVQEALHARQAMNKSVAFEQSDSDFEDTEPDRIVGRHPSMQDVYKMIGRVTQTDALVLIQGESGTGKELVARAIYHHSPRKNKMFLPINCAAIPDNLLESELFGHERGAFTGAVERRVGKFEQCDGGTLFLDEIGDFSPALQGKVLRLLEDQTFQRVGGAKWLTSDVRLIAATNCNLAHMVEEGQFRQDLYYRLNVVSITLPPLRERAEDIPELVRFFLRRYSRQYGREKTGISTAALEKLMGYSWPGNVRQLENAVKRALLIARGELLLVDDFDLAVRDSETPLPSGVTSPGNLDNAGELLVKIFKTLAANPPDQGILPWIERNMVQSALEYTGGNQVQAAKLLGIARNTLRARMRQLGLDNY
jgi:DNA-binding NtrC family response regulator